MPVIQLDWVTILIAVVAHFIFGFIWYTPLFGKAWAKEVGMDFDKKPETAEMMKAMGINLFGNFLMAFVLFHDMAIWNPVTWGQPAAEMSDFMFAFNAAFFIWLGFFLPVGLNSVAWEKRSWKLLGINTTYHFLSLFLVAFIIKSM